MDGLIIIDTIFDTIDNIMPGIIGFFSGVVISSKKRLKKYVNYYKSVNIGIRWFYAIFTLLYLIYIYKYLGKRVVESNIYIKLLAALFNITMLFYSSVKIF
jgi:hypothetical protein